MSMDITTYNKKIQELYKSYGAYLQTSDPKCVRVLHALLREAKKTGDDALLGNVYYSLAFTEYFVLGKYDAYLKYLRMAAKHLVRGDRAELGRVYYLMALDTLNKGMYDIAANYFLIARNLFAQEGQETSAGIMDDNVGHMMMLIGDHAMSRRYFRRALSAVRKDRNHPHYYSNVTGLLINDGMALLELRQVARAEKAQERAACFVEKAGDKIAPGTMFALALFEARIAAVKNDRKRVKRKLAEMTAIAGNIIQLTDYAEDVSRLSKDLFAHDNMEAVGMLIELMRTHPAAKDATVAHRVQAEILVGYHQRKGNAKELADAYRRQDAVYARYVQEQNESFRFSGELIRMAGDLRREQEEVQARHTALLHRVESDALTGIPNRYAMNIRLEEAFEQALQNRTKLGVGVIDVNGLKSYNDACGHPAGDERLKETGEILSKLSGQRNFFAARYGGDEFVLIFEDRTDREIRGICGILQKQFPLAASIGICNMVPGEKNKSWDFLSGADRAMYKAKRSEKGKNFYLTGKV